MWIKKNFDKILACFGLILLFVNCWLSNLYIRFIGSICVISSLAITQISIIKNKNAMGIIRKGKDEKV